MDGMDITYTSCRIPSMDGIYQAGQIHFQNASPSEKKRINTMFKSMDVDQNGRISKDEFMCRMKEADPNNKMLSLFAQLDRDQSESLEFHEFLAYYYAIISRPICDWCKELVMGLYYCCVKCWEMHMSDGHGHEPCQTFDVCAECFSKKLFYHNHTEFLDNYVLLRSKEILVPKKEKKANENPEMEAALKTGLSFYKALSDAENNAAEKLFREMDSDGDSRVSVAEVIAFLRNKGIPVVNASKVFKGMAPDHYLRIEDTVALWYIFATRPNCARCSDLIIGTYYGCVECHNMPTNGADDDAYALCLECYSSGKEFPGEHGPFLDNFGLLQMKNQLLRQGTATSYNIGGSQGTATSFNGGGQGITTSFTGAGEGTEGNKKHSKREILQMLANVAQVGAVAAAVNYAAAHGAGAAVVTAAPLPCSIM